MTTAIGVRIQATETSGTRMWPQVGPLIARVTGRGSIPGDGLGWMTNPGATLPFIMAGGCRFEDAGAGCRDHRKCGRFTRPLWLFSWAVGAGSAATWDGSR